MNFIQFVAEFNNQYNGVQRIYNHINGGYDMDNPLDFCPECMSAFDEFMIIGKEKKEKWE